MELDYARLGAKGFPKPILRVYLLQGSDDALKREALEKLTAPLLDASMTDFDRDEREASSAGAGEGDFARQTLASACSVPLLSERRVVVVNSVQRLAKEDQDALAVGLTGLGAQSCLVLIAGAPEYEAGKLKGRTAVGAKLQAAVAKLGATVQCDAPGEADLSARAQAIVKARGKAIAPDALRLITGRAKAAAADRGGSGKSGDIHVLTNELEKALAYIGERDKITREDALAVGLRSTEENIFALLDAVGHRDAGRALAEVDEMLRTGDKPDGVAARTFVMLARHLRLLYGAKFLAEQRAGAGAMRGAGLPPEVQAVLSGEMVGLTLRQSFLLRGLQEQARLWDYAALRDGLARVLASDMTMKGITPVKELGQAAPGDDPASNLRLLVIDLCRAPQEQAA